MCVIAATMIYLQTLGRAAAKNRESYAAALIPAIYTLLLLLVWVLPIQLFLISTFDKRALLPVLILTFLGVSLAANLPAAYFRLRRAEADGRLYAALGVRQFRSFVTYGDPMIRLMKRIDPKSHTHLKSSSVGDRERRTRKTEKIHWALLLGSVPTAVWAVIVNESWFAMYLVIANVPMNVYPILLQRYTRARLARIRKGEGEKMKS
jgi:hypothetical protein